MFAKCVAPAWARLLVNRNTISHKEEGFTFWPRPNFKTLEGGELWDFLDDNVIDLAITCKSEVWNAVNGRCVSIDSGYYIAIDSENEKFRTALAQVNLPAVYLEKELFSKLQQRLKGFSMEVTLLTSTTLRRFLRGKDLQGTSEDVASMLLEFCLLDAMASKAEGSQRTSLYDDFDATQLWPTSAATLSAPSNSTVLLMPRNESEMQLFEKSRAYETLNITKLSSSVRQLLLNDIEYLSAIMRYRRIDDLAVDWPVMYPLPVAGESQAGTVSRPSNLDSRLRDIWTWISDRVQEKSILDPPTIGGLMLLPINSSRIRTFAPQPGCPPVLVIQSKDALYHILVKLVEMDSVLTSPILEFEVLPAELMERFGTNVQLRKATGTTTVDDAATFIEWLVAGREAMSSIPNQEKEILTAHLGDITSAYKLGQEPSTTLIAQLCRLPIYTKLACRSPFE